MIEFQRWIVHSKVHDGVHTFSNRAFKITWEANNLLNLRAASSIVFLADCFVSDGAAFNRDLWEIGLGLSTGLGWFQCS